MSEITQHNSGRGWFWFWLLLTILFLVFCVWHSTSSSFTHSIPNQVDQRVAGIVEGTPLAGRYRVDGQDVVFSGDVPDTADVDGILQRVSNDPAVQQVRSSDLNIVVGSPASMQLQTVGDSLKLSGRLPDQSTVDSVTAAVEKAFPQTPIDSTLQVDSSVSAQPWMSNMGAFMNNFAAVQDPGLRAEGRRVELSGTVESSDMATNINGAASEAFGNSVAVRNAFSTGAPAVQKEAQLLYARVGEQVVLSGRVPDETAIDNLMGAAQSIFGEQNITSQLVAEPNTLDADWIGRGSSLFATLDGLQDGRAELVGNKLSVAGTVRTDSERESIIKTLGATAEDLTIVDEQISVVTLTPPALTVTQTTNGSVLLTGRVANQPTLDQITQSVVAAYPQGTVVTNNMTISDEVSDAAWADSLGSTLSQLADVQDGQLSISSTGITVAGQVESDDARSSVEQAASTISDQPIDNTISIVAVEKDSPNVTISRSDDSWMVSGSIADDDEKSALLKAIEQSSGGATIDDSKLVVDAQTALAPWINGVSGATAGLADVENASLAINQQGVTLTGTVETEAKRAAAGRSVGVLGVDPINNEIKVSAFTNPALLIEFPATEGQPAIINGSFGNQSEVDAVRSHVNEQLPGVAIEDELVVAQRTSEAPWTAGIGTLISAYQDSQAGKFSIADNRITLEGEVTDSGRQAVVAAANGLGLNAGLVDRLTIKQISASERLQDVDIEGIKFKHNSDELTPEGTEILNSVVSVLQSVPDANVEIGGHTDSVGPDDYNLDLSQRRSESVRLYLISQGIAEDRLVARGYGESQPVAPNSTSDGRSQNRRIEFVIQP